jgi:hypothetical protein
MIPPTVPPTTPYSERRIFKLLRQDPKTTEWFVLHSLGLPHTRIGPYGEIDFIVLVPKQGICCLEIKGGEVSCTDGVWRTRNRKTGETITLTKSPYLQAREGMFALRKAMQKHFGEGHEVLHCPLSYAVIFPDVRAPPVTPEAEPWETIDVGTLSKPLSGIIERNIAKTREKLGGRFSGKDASVEILTEIRKFLRPDFERVIARSSAIAQSEEQLVALTEEQYRYLDIAEVNERTLVTGAAGTGKTVLAIEHAKREANAGRSVLLLCFNRILGEWLNVQIEKSGLSKITARSFYSYLRHLIDQSSYAEEFAARSKAVPSKQVFSDLFPYYGELAILEQGVEVDTLVIDEAQDLVFPAGLAIFNSVLRGGLSGGRWSMFGDFTRQAIYGTVEGTEGESYVIEKLQEFVVSFPVIPLKMNCRNTRQIGEETALLSGFDSLPYHLAKVDGLPVDYRYWKNRSEEADQLEKTINMLLKEGINVSDIVILAAVRFENSVASTLGDRISVPIAEISSIGKGFTDHIAFSTIHAFKGMESPIVILCDFPDIATNEQRSLLYTGMSRARSHLIMLLPEKTKALLPDLLAKRLKGKWQQ